MLHGEISRLSQSPISQPSLQVPDDMTTISIVWIACVYMILVPAWGRVCGAGRRAPRRPLRQTVKERNGNGKETSAFNYFYRGATTAPDMRNCKKENFPRQREVVPCNKR